MSVSAKAFEKAINESGIAKIKWWKDWDKTDWNGRKGWSTKSGDPQGLLLHHNGGAATESTKPEDNKDCSKDDNGAKFVNRHPDFNSPASQFFLRRCGKLDVNAYTQCYHAGKGDFTGTDWAGHKIPKDSGNGYLMGVEIASKGKKNDFTEAQWETLTKLAITLKELYGWKDTGTYYFPRHKDWAGGRKNDIQASNKFVQGKFEEYGQLWDGKIPPYDSVLAAQADQTLANKAVFRLTNRLNDIGFGKSTPIIYEQTWPNKNYGLWCDANGIDADAVYTEQVHFDIFSNIEKYWDGQVPEYDHMVTVQADSETAYSASWRITCRLHDIGFGAQKSIPVKGEQSWPTKNYGLWSEANGVDPVAVYSPEVHAAIFGLVSA